MKAPDRNRTGNRQVLVLAGLSILAILLALGGISYRSVSQLERNARASLRAQEFQARLGALLVAVNDAETGVRGFVITGDSAYLEPYETAYADAMSDLHALSRLTADDARHRQLESLVPLLELRFAILREVRTTRETSGSGAAVQAIASGRGKRVHDQIRRHIQAIKEAEARILQQAMNSTEATVQLTRRMVLLGAIVAVSVALLAAAHAWRSRIALEVAEKALASGNALRQAILDGTDYAIIAGDDSGITLFNHGAERLLGYQAEEVVGRHSAGLFHDPAEVAERAKSLSRELGEPVEPGMEVFLARARRGLPDEREWTYLRKDGGRVPVQLSISALRNSRGAIVSFLGIAHDISARKRVIAELEDTLHKLDEARRRAQSADRLKSAFLATMSHELRTPLNSILGFSGILLQELAGPLNDEQRKQCELIRHSGRHLLALINDILDLSRIEANELKVESVPLDLEELARQAATSLQPLADGKGLRLVMDPADGVAALGDSRRVGQILLNLIGNAVKFTESGDVRVSLSADADTARVQVLDTGIGINAEDLGGLFRPFRQVDGGLARRFEGTGLGLAISQRLAELMGGHISVASTPGKGSVFTLILPRVG
jgi:PAS domain S-box-containing protein